MGHMRKFEASKELHDGGAEQNCCNKTHLLCISAKEMQCLAPCFVFLVVSLVGLSQATEQQVYATCIAILMGILLLCACAIFGTLDATGGGMNNTNVGEEMVYVIIAGVLAILALAAVYIAGPSNGRKVV